jgi:ferredoxin
MTMWIFIISVIAIAALVMAFQNRSGWKRTGEDIDEIRSSLYELRTAMKSMRAEWNLKTAKIHVKLLKKEGKITGDRMPYYITKECISCGSCLPECPTKAILENPIFEIEPALCIACGKCAKVCPVGACCPIEADEKAADN